MSDTDFLKLALSPNWEEMQSGELQALMRRGRANNNVVRISFTRNLTGRPLSPPPNPAGIATTLINQRGGRVAQTLEGQCEIGTFACVTYAHDDLAHGEVWIVTDGTHIFMATFSCDERPTAEELREVGEMVTSVTWKKA